MVVGGGAVVISFRLQTKGVVRWVKIGACVVVVYKGGKEGSGGSGYGVMRVACGGIGTNVTCTDEAGCGGNVPGIIILPLGFGLFAGGSGNGVNGVAGG